MNKTLSECLSLTIDRRGVTPKKLGSDWSDKGYRVLSANNVKTTGLQNINEIRFVDEETYKRWMKEEIEKGDIILTSEAPAGEVLFWDSDEKIVAGQRVYILRTKEDVDALFLKYYIQSEKGQAEIRNKCSGSTVFGISAKTFDSIEIVLPESIDEQKKISTLLYDIDKKIENNNKINAELESMAKTIYDYWFLQFEFPNEEGKPYKSSGGKMVWNEALKREIPEGWEAIDLANIIDISSDRINIEDIGNRKYVPIEVIPRKQMSFFETAEIEKAATGLCPFDEKAILLSNRRVYFHKVSITPYDGITRDTVIIINPKEEDNLGFVFQQVYSDHFIKYATLNSYGSEQPVLSPVSVEKYKIAYPNNNIDKKYSECVNDLINKVLNNQKENQELASLRDFLLPMLMNGQIGFKDGEK